MPAPYSVDLRKRVVAAYKAGEKTYEEIAAVFGVGRATVDRWIARYRKTGSVAPSEHGGGPTPQIDEDGKPLLVRILGQSPDLTLDELAQRYFEQRGGRTKGRELDTELEAVSDGPPLGLSTVRRFAHRSISHSSGAVPGVRG